MSQYFPTPSLDYRNIKAEIDLSNYATKRETNDIFIFVFCIKNKYS